MADLPRFAKSGNDWKPGDLRAFNIKVVYQNATTFFGGSLPRPTIRPELLTAESIADDQDDDLYIFLALLELASWEEPDKETAVDDFVLALFRELGYTRKRRVPRSRMDLEFVNCGEYMQVQTDVCVLDYPMETILLLVQEDKQHLDQAGPEPQLIAQAIAAFSRNNYIRTQDFHLPTLEEQVMLGITMRGSSPTFYKIPVTTALADAVGDGEYPDEQTVVHAYLPELPRPYDRLSEGMEPLDNRYIIFSCFQAFGQLFPTYSRASTA